MNKFLRSTVAGVLLSLVLANPVFAHVTVNPREAVPGYTVFTFRVPNERDVSTTELRVEVPPGVEVGSVMPVNGWKYRFKRDEGMEKPHVLQIIPMAIAVDDHGGEESGRITEITWYGGEIKAGEFMEFPVSAKYDGQPGKLAWKAYQTYEKGEITKWDGSDEKSPAPTVEVMATARIDALSAEVAKLNTGTQTSSQWLVIGAFLLSIASFGISLKRNR